MATNGFEEIELTAPRKKLSEAGATIDLVSDQKEIKSWKNGNWGITIKSDLLLDDLEVEKYDALVLPGGVINPDKLRRNKKAVELVKKFFEKDKVVAAICHGPWMLIEAGLVKGKRVTSFHSIKTDLLNAGGEWRDVPVATDRGIITSRNPDDIPQFTDQIIKQLTGY